MENKKDALRTIVPAVSVKDSGKEIILEAEMPGLKREDIAIEIEGDGLKIHGKKNNCAAPEGYRTIWSERCGYEYSRSFILTEEVNREKVQAKYADGLLTLTIPKSEHAAPRKIAIQ
ncbi:MAG: Hsp20/alpha crystallin family protein [Candidatus Omnitrophica bacterium]|nr:Hsp20/alpha crystallin family protein [Candidatus Omnitrophota bacterium]